MYVTKPWAFSVPDKPVSQLIQEAVFHFTTITFHQSDTQYLRPYSFKFSAIMVLIKKMFVTDIPKRASLCDSLISLIAKIDKSLCKE